MTQISPKRIRDAATELQSRKRKERREVLLTAKCKTEWKIEEDNLWMMKVFSFIGFCSVITWAEWSHSNYWDGWGGEREIPKRTRVSSREDWLASETAAALWTMVLWRGQWARPLDLQDWQTETRQPDFKPRQRSFKPISKGGYTIPWLFYTFFGYQTGKIKLSAIRNSVYFKVLGNFLRNQSYSTAIMVALRLLTTSITPSLTPKHVFVGFSKLYTYYVNRFFWHFVDSSVW